MKMGIICINIDFSIILTGISLSESLYSESTMGPKQTLEVPQRREMLVRDSVVVLKCYETLEYVTTDAIVSR